MIAFLIFGGAGLLLIGGCVLVVAALDKARSDEDAREVDAFWAARPWVVKTVPEDTDPGLIDRYEQIFADDETVAFGAVSALPSEAAAE